MRKYNWSESDLILSSLKIQLHWNYELKNYRSPEFDTHIKTMLHFGLVSSSINVVSNETCCFQLLKNTFVACMEMIFKTKHNELLIDLLQHIMQSTVFNCLVICWEEQVSSFCNVWTFVHKLINYIKLKNVNKICIKQWISRGKLRVVLYLKKIFYIKNFNIFSLKTNLGEDATQVNGCFSKNSQKEAVYSNKSLHSRYEGVHRLLY